MIPEDEHEWTPQQRARIVIISIVAAIVVIAGGFFGYQVYQKGKGPSGMENVQDLGHGFKRATIVKTDKFGTGRFPFFFYKDKPLCQVGPGAEPSISPSGKYAVYQDARNGKLILFRARDEKVIELTKVFVGIANPYTWHEDEGTIECGFAKEGLSQVFPLQ